MDPSAWHQRALPQTTTAAAAAANSAKKNTGKKPKNRTWDENFQSLLLYKQEHGDVCVPHKYQKDRVLAKWVSHLREYYNTKQLSPERIEALEAIGMVWNPHEKKWNDNYARLVAFWKEHGHSKVPTVYKADPALGKWVSRQREDFSGNYMPEHRKKKLDALGFVYRISKTGGRQKRNRPDDDRWEQRYAELVEFHKTHGHSNVPRPDDATDKLSGWVGVQRCNFSRGLMPQERIDKLKKLDFVFNFSQKKKQEEWNRMYELLKVCQKKDDGGGFHVAIVGDDAASLSRWIQRQREKYKLYKLEPGREILLRKLEFRFPERPPRESKDDGEQSESLKRTLAEIDNARPEDLFGDEGRQKHMKGDTSMVEAIVDLAGEDKDLGKKVADSIGLLSKFMSVSPEELATRMSAPMSHRNAATTTTTTSHHRKQSGPKGNAFAVLMPLIVQLREAASEAAMKDCAEFLVRMIKKNNKTEGALTGSVEDPDTYNKLLTLAVELSSVLDGTQRSQAVIESCSMYLNHILSQEVQQRTGNHAPAVATKPAPLPSPVRAPLAKRPRKSRDWDNEIAGTLI